MVRYAMLYSELLRWKIQSEQLSFGDGACIFSTEEGITDNTPTKTTEKNRFLFMNWKRFVTFILGLALVHAFQMSWLCDDAFLSFRYAEHLAQGKGLVFNEGEYVEGYSNFLWTVLLALGIGIGIEPEVLSIIMGLFFFSGTLLVLSNIGKGMLAPLAVAGIYHMRVFATAGLESSMFWFFLACVVWTLLTNRTRLCAMFSVLCVLCRPEGMIVIPLVLFSLPSRRKNFAMYALIPTSMYLLWKMWYFGDILPNTYWAKGSEARWGQGATYFSMVFGMYGLSALGWIACFRLSSPAKRFLLGFTLILTFQLWKGGGGFMFARLALPIILCLVIAMELWASEHLSKKHYPLVSLSCGLLLYLSPYPSALSQGMVDGIVEEKSWYPKESVKNAKKLGFALRNFAEDTDIRVAILGAQAMLAYYAKLPYVLESMAGLTDKELARMPAKDVRIGHGKKASLKYMRKRNIDILLTHRNPMSAPDWAKISMGNVEGVLVTYRMPLIKKLRKKGASVLDVPKWLDEQISMDTPMEQRRMFAEQMRDYYLLPSKDKARMMKVLDWAQIDG